MAATDSFLYPSSTAAQSTSQYLSYNHLDTVELAWQTFHQNATDISLQLYAWQPGHQNWTPCAYTFIYSGRFAASVKLP